MIAGHRLHMPVLSHVDREGLSVDVDDELPTGRPSSFMSQEFRFVVVQFPPFYVMQ